MFVLPDRRGAGPRGGDGAGGGFTGGPAGGREHRKPLGDFDRAAMRALGPLPFAGPHQHFAVLLALVAMKFVNRHGLRITARARTSSGKAWAVSIKSWATPATPRPECLNLGPTPESS